MPFTGNRRSNRHSNPAARSCSPFAGRSPTAFTHSGVAWFLDGDQRHRQRLLAELDAAAGFPDWNRTHFIDTAEMMAAVALGRDWLRETMIGQPAGGHRRGDRPARLDTGAESLRGGSAWTKSRQQLEHRLLRRCDRGRRGVRSVRPELCQEIIELRLGRHALPGNVQLRARWRLARGTELLGIRHPLCGSCHRRAGRGRAGLAQIWAPRPASPRHGALASILPARPDWYSTTATICRSTERCPALGWLAARSGDPEAAEWQRVRAWAAPSLRPDLVRSRMFPACRNRQLATVFAKAGVATLRDPGEHSGLLRCGEGRRQFSQPRAPRPRHLRAGGERASASSAISVVTTTHCPAISRPIAGSPTCAPEPSPTTRLSSKVATSRSRHPRRRLSRDPIPALSAVAFSIDDPDSPCLIRPRGRPGAGQPRRDRRSCPSTTCRRRHVGRLAHSHQGRRHVRGHRGHAAARRNRTEASACCALPRIVRTGARPNRSRRGRQQRLHESAWRVSPCLPRAFGWQ